MRKKIIWASIFLTAAGGLGRAWATPKPDERVVADFNSGKPVNNLGQEIEVWLLGDGSDKTQNCQMSFVSDDALGKKNGRSVRLDYDVESENPAYNGIRMGLGLLDPSPYRYLNLYLRGDAGKGFTQKLKVELIGKDKPPAPRLLTGIHGEWQKVSIPLTDFWVFQTGVPRDKFVVVFADINSDPKTGTIYLDQVTFSK